MSYLQFILVLLEEDIWKQSTETSKGLICISDEEMGQPSTEEFAKHSYWETQYK